MRNAVHSISLDNHPIVVLTVIAVANYSLITYHYSLITFLYLRSILVYW